MIKEKAIKWFAMLKEKFVDTEYEKYLEMAIEALKDRTTGHWIEDCVCDGDNLYRCSCCNDSFFIDMPNYKYDYCPSCGAKMA